MKELQIKVKAFCSAHNLGGPVEHRVLDLASEVGEVAKEVLKMSEYDTKKLEYREELADELGDVLFSLMVIANEYDISLERQLNVALSKYQRRLQKGSAGSDYE